MQTRFTKQQLTDILDQASIYVCACPAQLCQAILEQRKLYNYQAHCLNDNATDHQVHTAIARTVEETHALLEACLIEVLLLEGWDMQSLRMPTDLAKRLVADD